MSKKKESRSEKKSKANKQASEMKEERENNEQNACVCVTVRADEVIIERKGHITTKPPSPPPPPHSPRASVLHIYLNSFKQKRSKQKRVKNKKHAAENIQMASSVPGFGARGCLSAYLYVVLVLILVLYQEKKKITRRGAYEEKRRSRSSSSSSSSSSKIECLKRKVEESKRGWQ